MGNNSYENVPNFTVYSDSDVNVQITTLNNIIECINTQEFTNNIQDKIGENLNAETRLLIILNYLIKQPAIQEYLNAYELKQQKIYNYVSDISDGHLEAEKKCKGRDPQFYSRAEEIKEILKNLSWAGSDDLTKYSPLVSFRRVNNNAASITDDFITKWLMDKYRLDKNSVLYRAMPLDDFNKYCAYNENTNDYKLTLKKHIPYTYTYTYTIDYYNQNAAQKEKRELYSCAKDLNIPSLNVSIDMESVIDYKNGNVRIISLKLQDILAMNGKIYPDRGAAIGEELALILTVPTGEIQVKLVKEINVNKSRLLRYAN